MSPLRRLFSALRCAAASFLVSDHQDTYPADFTDHCIRHQALNSVSIRILFPMGCSQTAETPAVCGGGTATSYQRPSCAAAPAAAAAHRAPDYWNKLSHVWPGETVGPSPLSGMRGGRRGAAIRVFWSVSVCMCRDVGWTGIVLLMVTFSQFAVVRLWKAVAV